MNVKTAEPPICRQTVPKPRIKFQNISGMTVPEPHTLAPRRGKGEGGMGKGRREIKEDRGMDNSFVAAPKHTAVAAYDRGIHVSLLKITANNRRLLIC